MKKTNSLTKLMMVAGCLTIGGHAFAQSATPVANNDAASVAAGGTVNINVLGNDSHPQAGATLSIVENTDPSVGTLVLNANNTFSYTAPAGYSGTVTFTYTIQAYNACPEPTHTYQFVNAPGISWQNAKAAAEAMTNNGRQGYLATITCESENQQIYNLFDVTNRWYNAWIGGSDAEEEGTWKWVTGPEAGDQFSEEDLSFLSFIDGFLPQLTGAFHKWSINEPNQQNGEEDYAHFQAVNGYWNDKSNEVNLPDIQGYIVEFGGLEATSAPLTATATVTITVNGGSTPTPIPNPTPNGPCVSITVTPSNCTYTGGVPTNIYIGYGPQSATIKANVAGTSNNNGWGCGNNNNNSNGYTYSWSPATHLSNPNIKNPVFTPTQAGVYTYTVTVSKNGASSTKSVTFCVKDIRVPNSNSNNNNNGCNNGWGNNNGCNNGWGNNNGCGGNNNSNNQQKVYLCHKTYSCWGNSSTTQTLSVPVSQVASYLSYYSQDRLGSCNQTCGGSARGVEEEVIEVGNFEMKAYPNPTDGAFSVVVPFTLSDVVVRIVDMYGKMITIKTVKPTDDKKIDFDLKSLTPGMYLIDVTDGAQHSQAKITKQ